MTEFIAVDYDVVPLAKYSDEGRILFRVWVDPVIGIKPCQEFEVLDYDHSSVMWLAEGMGIEYFLEDIVGADFDTDGVYVLEGVHGQYIRGNWYDDDDEVWCYGNFRRATIEEETTEALVHG